MLERWKEWARTIKRDVYALYLAARDPRVPWYAKALALAVAAYAASPIDLIPDFIPVIGYVDELFILPLGIALAIRLYHRKSWPSTGRQRRRRPWRARARPSSSPPCGAWFSGLLGWWGYRYFYR